MPLIPLIIAARNARDLIQLARKTLEHYRELPRPEQERLRGEAERVRSLAAELGSATTQSVRGRVRRSSGADAEPARDPKVVGTQLRDALARLSGSMADEVATIAKGESRKVRYAAKAVRFGARRLESGDAAVRPAGAPEAQRLIEWARAVFGDAGLTPTDEQLREMASTAASLIVKTRYLPLAVKHPVTEFVDDLDRRTITSETWLEQFDEIRERLLDTATKVELERAGDGKRMYDIHHRRVLKVVEELDDEFKALQRPIWAQDVRREAELARSASA